MLAILKCQIKTAKVQSPMSNILFKESRKMLLLRPRDINRTFSSDFGQNISH